MPFSDAQTPRPAAAYLRQLPGARGEDLHKTLAGLLAFTAQRGFTLAAVHCEEGPGERLATWAALITNCRSEGITHIVVPGPEHFHRDAVVAAYMREELAERVRGRVWYASEAGRCEH